METSKSTPIDLLVMLGDVGPTVPEQILGNVREAIALDMIEKGLELDEIDRIIVGRTDVLSSIRFAGFR